MLQSGTSERTGIAFVFHPSPTFHVRQGRRNYDVVAASRSIRVDGRSYRGFWQLRNGLELRMATGEQKKSDQTKVEDISDPKPNIRGFRFTLCGVYLGFIVYGLFLAPGSWNELGQIGNILSGHLEDTNDLFFAIFNLLAATGMNFAALLNAGASKQKKLPTELFSLLGLFLGFIGLGPYLVGRGYVSNVTWEDVQERSLISRVLESRIFSIGTVLYALWAYAFAFGIFTPGTIEYHDVLLYSSWVDLSRLFAVDRGVCTSCIDMIILSTVVWGPLTEDMSRRGWFQKGREIESTISALSFMFVPALGPAIYLAFRSSLPKREHDPIDSSD